MAKKNPARTEATRKRIMDAYWELFEADPASPITVTQISGRAKVHRTTFYEYFQDVRAVREAIEEDILAYMRPKVNEILASGVPRETVVRAAMAILKDKGRYIAILYTDQAGSPFMDEIKEQLVALLVGSDASADGLDRYEAEFAVSGLLATYALWFRRGMDVPIEALAADVMQMANAALGR